MDQTVQAHGTRARLRAVAFTDQLAAARERLADGLDLLVINTAVLAYRRERMAAERVAYEELRRYRSNGTARAAGSDPDRAGHTLHRRTDDHPVVTTTEDDGDEVPPPSTGRKRQPGLNSTSPPLAALDG